MLKSIFPRFPGGLSRALTFSYDDDVTQNIRLLEAFRKYGCKATFNLNAGRFRGENEPVLDPRIPMLTEREALDLFADDPSAEVACHGEHHTFMQYLPTALTAQEVLNDRLYLEKMFHRIIKGMAYPFGDHNDDVVEILRLAGIRYCRKVGSSLNFDLPRDWRRLQATCHHGNKELFNLADRFLEPCHGVPKLFYVWGHAYEFDLDDNWDRMETLLQKVGGREDVWYCTNGELYDYLDAYGRLEYAADGSLVHNPTAVTLWIGCPYQVFCIRPGETLEIDVANLPLKE